MGRLRAWNFAAVTLAAAAWAQTPAADSFDVVVVGATPAGIAAAVAAARQGTRVALVEETDHVGAMLSRGGMSYSDLWLRNSEGALFMEYVRRVRRHYTGKADVPEGTFTYAGYAWEPKVAEKIFGEMLSEQANIQVLTGHRLRNVIRHGNQVVGAEFDRAQGLRRLAAPVFIDATYEGDLAALAGADYRLGRETRSEYNEQHAGVIYQDIATKRIYPGSSGQGDNRVQAFIVLIVVTKHPENRIPIARPAGYDRTRYLTLLDDLKQGYAKTLEDFYIFIPMPGDKFCLNNSYKVSISADLPEANTGYAEGNTEQRRQIASTYLEHTLGLMYFLQNDAEVPDALRREALAWGLPADEFADNQHVPSQLYVREARRIAGEYTFTENDGRDDPANRPEAGHPRQIDVPYMYPTYGVLNLPKQTLNQRPPIHSDSIAVGTYFFDSHSVQRWQPGHEDKTHVFEGTVHLDQLTLPSQLPYRIMLPKKVDGLLVPVAVSATHIGFAQIRMEPVWMALGQAAGIAAGMAVSRRIPLRQIPVDLLQQALVNQKQVITYFTDVPFNHPHFSALQFFGARGFFPAFTAAPDAALLAGTALRWLSLALNVPEPQIRILVDEAHGSTPSDAPLDPSTALQWAQRAYRVSRAAPSEKWRSSRDPVVKRSEFCQLLYSLAREHSDTQ